jgi:diguanylate cyclase (GGDEF)-like protein
MSTHPPMKQESNTVDRFSETQEPTHALYDWRSSVLDIFLPLASLAFLPSIVQTVLQVINDPQVAWQGAAIIVFFYLILVFVTFTPRRISTTMRSWIVVALTYLTGIVSMARGGLAGDGTLFLTVLPILAITLVNARTGIYAAGVSISTFILFGILAHAGILNPWLIIHDNPQTPDQWLYFGLAMSTLIIVTVFVVIRFSNFQLETLKAVQEMAKALADSHQQLELANRKLEQKVQERTAELSDANQHLQFLATHDNLTGLPNRFLFFDRLGQAIKKSRRQKRRFALFFIDLDDFKRINDSFGHIIGDQVLQTVANVLDHAVRDSDTVARLAGDEFMIILDDIREVSDIEAIARKINLAVSQPIDVPQETVIMTVSIGISLFPEHGEDAETLLRKADEAMYYVKNGTQNSYHIHSE